MSQLFLGRGNADFEQQTLLITKKVRMQKGYGFYNNTYKYSSQISSSLSSL